MAAVKERVPDTALRVTSVMHDDEKQIVIARYLLVWLNTIDIMPAACLSAFDHQLAAMTERGKLATEAQREDMQLLVERFEELKAEEQPYKDENMVGDIFSSFFSDRPFKHVC